MKPLNEFFIRFNDDGAIKGSCVRYLETYTTPSGVAKFELGQPKEVNEADLTALIADLNVTAINENIQLKTELEQLRSQQGLPIPIPQTTENWKALPAALVEADFD